MADEQIPEYLLQAQRRFDAAHAAVVAACRRPGPVASWPPDAIEELDRLRAEELAAALAQHDVRAGTAFEAYEMQKRVLVAARSTADRH